MSDNKDRYVIFKWLDVKVLHAINEAGRELGTNEGGRWVDEQNPFQLTNIPNKTKATYLWAVSMRHKLINLEPTEELKTIAAKWLFIVHTDDIPEINRKYKQKGKFQK